MFAEFAEQLHPTDAEGYYGRGLLKHNARDYYGAIADYTEAIRLSPDETDEVGGYYSLRAYLRHKLGDLEGAIADFSVLIRRTIRLYPDDPDNADLYESRGGAYYAKGDMESAISDYTEAIRLNVESDRAYERRGEARFVLKQYEQALSDFERAYKLFPTRKTLAGIAIANWKLGDKREAIYTWLEIASDYEDIDFYNAKWVGEEFEWAQPLIDTADRVIEVSDIDTW